MLEALKFVKGAVQRNGVTPELEHFTIKDGRVTGFNGYMALSSPLPLDIEAMPKADLFHKALEACGDSIAIALTPNGRLHIRSGTFSAYIPCIDKAVYDAQPEGESFPAPKGMAAAFARMLPFVGDDASRPWAMGLSIAGGTYTATNNVILLQLWDGHQLPTVNCPRFAVAEVARLKVDPVEICIGNGSISFLYENGRWLRSQVLATDWPVEMMNKILNRESAPVPVPEGFFDAVDKLAPFTTEGPSSPIHFTEVGMTTGAPGSSEGAGVAMEGLPDGAAFRLKALQLLRNEVKTIDLGMHPAPCLFFGDNSRGALIGMQF